MAESFPSAEAVAGEIKAKRATGRPKGSKDTRPRKPRGRPVEAPEEERPPYQPTEEGIVLSGVLGKTLWDLTTLFTRHRGLNAEEQRRLGEALDPVLYKYIPVLDDFKAEATLVMVCWALWQATAPVEAEVGPDHDSQGERSATGLGIDAQGRTASRATVLD